MLNTVLRCLKIKLHLSCSQLHFGHFAYRVPREATRGDQACRAHHHRWALQRSSPSNCETRRWLGRRVLLARRFDEAVDMISVEASALGRTNGDRRSSRSQLLRQRVLVALAPAWSLVDNSQDRPNFSSEFV